MSRPLRTVITFLIGSFVFVALPIVAWDVTDVRGFFAQPARVLYIVFVILLNAFAAYRIPEVGKSHDPAKTTVARQHLTVIFLQVLSISVVLLGPFCDHRGIAVMGSQDTVRYIGLLLYFVGFLVMHFAEAKLGRQFSLEVSISEGHTLVTDGMYRYLRHPRYLGITTFTVGLSMLFRSWIGLGISGVTLLVLLWRIHDEEALMQKEFGGEWEAYARRSWRLLPFVY